jgi:hypothetical protein
MCKLPFRIAFAGHRSLSGVDLAAAEKAIVEVFDAIADGCARAGQQSDWQTAWRRLIVMAAEKPGGSPVEPWLLCGHADGADRLAVAAWWEAGAGPLHGVFPVCNASGARGFDDLTGSGGSCDLASGTWDGPGDRATFPTFARITALDGAAAQRVSPQRSPHLEQTRFLVRWTDMLVAVWNGRLPTGPGGTADAVTLALSRGLPVVWIDTGRDCSVRMLQASRFWGDGSLSELVHALEDRPESLAPLIDREALTAITAELVQRRLGPPTGSEDNAETAARQDFERADAELEATPGRDVFSAVGWRRRVAATWPVLLRALSGQRKASASGTAAAPSEELAAPGMALIHRAMARAEDTAKVYGDLHRGLQIWLMLIAVLAVAVGTAAAVAPSFKWYFVVSEFALAMLALAVWRLRLLATNHQRWSDSRRYAERLRVMAATWPMGFDVADERSDLPTTWTEWRSRAVLRLAGPPTGALTETRLMQAAQQAIADPNGIVRGQLDYHRANAKRMGRAHHHLHAAETSAFYGLVAALVLFAIAYPWFPKQSPPSWPPNPGFWPNRLGGALLMLSAVVPAFAAAVIALEAKIGFRENAERSAYLAEAFAALTENMSSPSPPHTSSVWLAQQLRKAGRLHLADADAWREGAIRREIVKL